MNLLLAREIVFTVVRQVKDTVNYELFKNYKL